MTTIETTHQMDAYMEAVKKAIDDGIRSYLDREYERIKQELLEKLEREKDAVIAGTMLNFSRHVEMHSMGMKVIVEIAKTP